VPVICTDPDLGGTYIQAVAEVANPVSSAEVGIEGSKVQLTVLATDPEQDATWAAQVRQAQALIMLVRFMDSATMQALSVRHSRLEACRQSPMGIFIVRTEGEQEFKISCVSCRQKMWVSEQHIGRHGKCPSCRAPFTVPTQTEYLRQRLSLPDAVPVLKILQGNTALCRGALANLLARTGPGILAEYDLRPGDFLNKSTVPIQLDNEAVQIK
jgi:transposase-like protein